MDDSNPVVVYSRSPQVIPRRGDDQDAGWSTGWIAGTAFAAFMMISGGFVGYRGQMKSSSPPKLVLESLSSKPHPFLKAPPRVNPLSTVTATHIAAKGIATVYCFAGFSFSLAGVALACGVRSPRDVEIKLGELKEWGPRARKRLLVSVGVGESAAEIEAERELNETAHLSAEDQFTRLLEKHGDSK